MIKSKAKKFGLTVLSSAMLAGIVNPFPVIAAEPLKGKNDIAAQAFDTTKPVFERLELPQNGQRVKVGDKIPIYVYAYDADSGIKTLETRITFTDKELDLYEVEYILCEYNEQSKRYEGVIEVIDGGYTKLEISKVVITDNSGNILEDYLEDLDNVHAMIEGGTYVDNEKGIIAEASDIQITKMNQVVSDKAELTVSVTLPENANEDIDSLNAEFYNDSRGYIGTTLNKSTTDPRLFTGTITFNYNGKYRLDVLDAHNSTGINMGRVTYSKMDDVWVEVEKEDSIVPVFKSIEMTHRGEFVKPGDRIDIRVKASDNDKLEKSGYVGMRAVMDNIENRYHSVEVTYNEKEDVFEGVFEITKDTYPCEWYVDDVRIDDVSGNGIDNLKLNLEEDYYVRVKNGNTFVNPSYKVDLQFYSLNSKGEMVKSKEFKGVEADRRSKWGDVIKSMPNGSTAYKGLKFKEWSDEYGGTFTLDKEVLDDDLVMYFASYDKKIVRGSYHYPNKNLKSDYGRKGYPVELIVDPDETYENVFKQLAKKEKPSNMYSEAVFTGWDMDTSYRGELRRTVNELDFYAKFKDKAVVNIYKDYYDENGKDALLDIQNKLEYAVVDKNTTYQTLMDRYGKRSVKHYKGLRFKEWDIRCPYGQELEPIKDTSFDYSSIYFLAKYENCMVNFIVQDKADEFGSTDSLAYIAVKPIVVEKGAMVTFPNGIGAYKDVKWKYSVIGDFLMGGRGVANYKSGEKVKVTSNIRYIGYTDSGTEPNQPIINPEVNNKLSQAVIDEIADRIETAKSGEVIEVTMNNATVVPKHILEVLKGKDVTVKLNMKGYTWTINGKDIFAENLKDINLKVTFNTNNIPNDVVSQLAQGNPVKQLSLAHNGNFGFKANLTFDIGDEFKGKYGNLYYYDSDRKMVFMNAGQIKEDGKLTVSFSHASEYAIVISDTATPNTGDETNASLYLMLMIMTLGMGSYFLWKKHKETV